MIYLGADHGGYKLKEAIKNYLEKQGIRHKDLGAYDAQSSDHPDYAFKVARKVARSKGQDKGILICSTGVGMAITANRIKGVRAVNGWEPKVVKLAREHNDANVLTLGGKFVKPAQANKLVDIFLKTKPLNKIRYQRRIKKYDQ